MSQSLHEPLKNWIIELAKSKVDGNGKSYYDNVYTADSQPLDIRRGKKHFTYQPDVVLDRKGRTRVLEIAQTEKWRSWVGELALAKSVSGFWGICLILFEEDDEFVGSIFHVMEKVLDLDWWGYLILEGKETNDLKAAQKKISSSLKEWDWL